jgi:hypothetical protein
MELTIEIPERLVKRAEELGLPVKTLVDQALNLIADAPVGSKATSIVDLIAVPEDDEIDFDPPRFGEAIRGDEPIPPGFVRLGVPTMTRAEATASIREIQRTHTLGGLSIRELINEGRRP